MADFSRGGSKDKENSKPADAWVMVSFVPKVYLEDETLSEEEILEKKLIPTGSAGCPIYADNKKGGAVVFDKIIRARYEEIAAYLDSNPGSTMHDPDCPKLEFLKEVVIRVNSAKLAKEILGIDREVSGDIEI